MINTVCAYAASSDGVASEYLEVAGRFGALLAARGHSLVYGGGNCGLMGAVARAVHGGGGQVVGVIPEKLRAIELAYEGADELIVTAGMQERKAIMAARGDAFVALPGGFGTLEEVLEIIVLNQLEYHHKPLAFLNVGGVYDGLLDYFEQLIAAKFAPVRSRGLYHVAETPEGVFAYFDDWVKANS